MNYSRSIDAEFRQSLKEFEKVSKEIRQYLNTHNIDIPITCSDPKYNKYNNKRSQLCKMEHV